MLIEWKCCQIHRTVNCQHNSIKSNIRLNLLIHCLFIDLLNNLLTFLLFTHLLVYLFTRLLVYLFTCLLVYLFTSLLVCLLFIYQFVICLFLYLRFLIEEIIKVPLTHQNKPIRLNHCKNVVCGYFASSANFLFECDIRTPYYPCVFA